MLNKMDESGSGYICLDCQNTEAFEATSDLYRLYKRNDDGSYDFNSEIVCPYRLECWDCNSTNIGIEISSGKIIKDNKLAVGKGPWLVGYRWLLDVSSTNDLEGLVRLICDYEDEQNSFDRLYLSLKDKGFKSWKWDENFDPFKLALVQIVSNGIIVQNENGLLEEDSRHKNARYVAI
jgi:hypothetical protein